MRTTLQVSTLAITFRLQVNGDNTCPWSAGFTLMKVDSYAKHSPRSHLQTPHQFLAPLTRLLFSPVTHTVSAPTCSHTAVQYSSSTPCCWPPQAHQRNFDSHPMPINGDGSSPSRWFLPGFSSCAEHSTATNH